MTDCQSVLPWLLVARVRSVSSVKQCLGLDGTATPDISEAANWHHICLTRKGTGAEEMNCQRFFGEGGLFMLDSCNCEDSDAESAEGRRPMLAPGVLPISAAVFRHWPRVEVKQGLLWTFKEGGQFGNDEVTITVVDILEKRVTIAAHLNSSDITCSGTASLALHLANMTLLVEEVGHKKTKLRILSLPRVAIRRA